MSTMGRSIRTALRTRVNMSAIGSVIMASPARLLGTGDDPLVTEFAKTESAQLEFAIHSSRPAAQRTAMLCPRAELRFAFGFFDFCFAGHSKPFRWYSQRRQAS